MKTHFTFLIISLFFAFSELNAQQSNQTLCYSELTNSKIKITSKEELNMTGAFTVTLTITALDTIYIDSLGLGQDNYLVISANSNSAQIQPAQSPWFSSTTLLPGNSATCDIDIAYNSNDLPYYTSEFDILLFTHNVNDTIAKTAITSVKVYFTPYNTIEVWDIKDFVKLPRVWEHRTTPSPSRIFIHKDSIPSSTKPDIENITEEWETHFVLKHIEGLPYAIEMAAIHPDTILAVKYRDSLDAIAYMEENLGIDLFGKTFSGTITGRLVATYINDNNETVELPLEGIRIEAWDTDEYFDDYLNFTHSDVNGNFSLTYETWQTIFEGHQIELYIKWKSENSNYLIDIIKDGTLNSTFNITFSTVKTLGGAGSNYSFDIGNIHLGSHDARDPYKLVNWTTKAYKFTKSQISNTGIPNGLNVYAYDDDNITGGRASYCMPKAIGSFSPYISLLTSDVNHESTIWHEFGHFAMNWLQGDNYLTCANDFHDYTSALSTDLAWTEGWATGYMCMLDVYYRNHDGESGRESQTEGLSSHSNERRVQNVYRGGINGMRSEYFVSSTINDLFDGPVKFSGVNGITASDYNDQGGMNGFINGEQDDLELTALQICKPLLDGPMPNNISEYYVSLLKRSNCETASKIKKIFFQNGIRTDYTNNSNTLSGDEIGTLHQTVTYTCPPLNNAQLVMNSLVEPSHLMSYSTRFNIASLTQTDNNNIVDDITISNGGVLGVNKNENYGYINSNTLLPLANSLMKVEACSQNIIIGNNGILEIGSMSNPGELKLLKGNITIQNGGLLKLMYGSTLQISNGTILKFENGANIQIDATSNIEIQDGGLIEIGNGATFTWTGKGYIKVNNDPNQPGKVNVRAAAGATQAKFFKQGAWVSQDGGYTEKLIEINSGSLSFDRSIEEVNIKFGLIKLHSETFVDVEPMCYFDNVTFDWAGSGQKHNGLWVYGQQNTPYVSGCKFKNATRGITVFPLVQGVGVKNGVAQSTHATITNSSFNLCDMAIYVDARGADITNCSFTNASGGNDHSGIVLRGLQYNSRLETITSQLNNIGIDLLGTFHNETSVKRSVIFNNATAGIMGRGTKLALGCNAIYNNASTTNRGYNIWMHPGTRLIAENAISPGSNYNNLSSYNSSAVYLDNVFGLHIQDGYTDFESVNEGILGTMIPYQVTSNPSQFDALKINYARNNYWDRFGASPQMFTHHAVAFDDGWTVYFVDFDDLGTSLSSKPDIIGNCYLGETGEEPPSMFIGKSMIYDAENTPFDLKYMQARDYKLSHSYMDAYNEYKEIVTHAYDTLFNITGADNIMTSEFREWMDVVLFSYSEMMECINEAYALGQIDSTYDLQDILDVQTLLRNKMNIETITDTLQSHYAYDFLYKFDEAMLHRLFNDRETCKNKLYAMKSNIQTVSNSSLLNYYYCLVSKEQVMLSDTLNKAYLFTTFECDSFFPTVNYGPPIEVDNKKTSLRETSTELFKHTHIYPNPASDKISVKFDERVQGVHIQIIDLTGRVLQQKKMEGILHKVDIPIDMQTGSYIIQIATDKGTVRKKFVVIK